MNPHEVDPPERLWHYTSGAGARGIFTSGTLWAGHLGYMNDSSEFDHAVALSLEIARRLRDELEDHKAGLEKWINYLTDSPPESWTPNVFAVSLSESDDLLSQWRAYGTGRGGPFCIGFLSETLRLQVERTQIPRTRNWRLVRCIYDPEEQRTMLEGLMRENLQWAAKTEADSHTETSSKGADLEFSALFSAVWGAAPSLKHPAFSEEREWRLILGPADPSKLNTVHWVERQHTLAPYVEFPLHAEGGHLDGVRWIAGPGPQQHQAQSAIGMVARLAGVTGYQGWSSRTPYVP
ncbi:DUF2971 domain-containing protein [Janibacter sp. G368]|uniref:DUF2971 domain-containing protein n=1 Tax=Janibacter sp. G368 TaxID=3420441 RepID=UPI003D084B4F